MFNFVKKYTTTSIVVTLILGILLWSLSLFNIYHINIQNQNYTPFFLFINKIIAQNHFIGILITFLLVIFEVIILTDISVRNNVFGKNTLIYALVYTILTGYIYVQYFSPVLIANLFAIPAFLLLINSIQKEENAKTFINITLLLSISSLFYAPYLFLLLFVILAILIIKARINREIFSIIFATAFLFLLYLEINYLITGKIFNLNEIWNFISPKQVKFHFNLFNKIYLGYISLLFIIASFFMTNSISTRPIQKRIFYRLNFLFFLYVLLMYIFIPSAGSDFWLTISLPLSFLFSDYFVNAKETKINKLLFVLFILNPFILQIGLLTLR